MPGKSLLEKYPLPETREEAMWWLCGNNPSGRSYTPYWRHDYGRCYFRPRISGRKTTEYFVGLLGIQNVQDCRRVRAELRRLKRRLERQEPLLSETH